MHTHMYAHAHTHVRTCTHVHIGSLLVGRVACVNAVEDLPGKSKEVVDVVDVPAPSLELLLGLQFSCLEVYQWVIESFLEVKLLREGGPGRERERVKSSLICYKAHNT